MKKRARLKLRNRILKGISAAAAIAYVLAAFYVDSDAWSLHDLYWQVPLWIVCYGWGILFIYANSESRADRQRRQKRMRRASQEGKW